MRKKRPYIKRFHRDSGPLVDAVTTALAFKDRLPLAEIAELSGLDEADLLEVFADYRGYLARHGYCRTKICVPDVPLPSESARIRAEIDRQKEARLAAQGSPSEVPPGREPTRTHWRQVGCPV